MVVPEEMIFSDLREYIPEKNRLNAIKRARPGNTLVFSDKVVTFFIFRLIK